MFLILSKTLDLLIAPVTWALVLAILAWFWLRGRPRLARFLLALAIVDVAAFSFEPVSRWLFRKLETRALSTFHPDPPYDVVVVLGGMIEPSSTAAGRLELNDCGERILAAADLLRTGQAKNVLISGGTAFPQPGETPEAEVLARWLREQGFPAERIFSEPASRNTRENATLSAPIIAAHGWKRVLLVTSAWHAARALGCFRAVGLEPDLLPVDHRSVVEPSARWLPRAGNLANSTDALRELFGSVVYRLWGYAK